MKGANRLKAPGGADRVEPALAAGHVANLIAIDDVENGGALRIARSAQAVRHIGGDVKSSRFQNERRDGKPGKDVAAGLGCGLPQPVMGRQIAIGASERAEACGDHLEMARLLAADFDPVRSKGRRIEPLRLNRAGK